MNGNAFLAHAVTKLTGLRVTHLDVHESPALMIFRVFVAGLRVELCCELIVTKRAYSEIPHPVLATIADILVDTVRARANGDATLTYVG